MTRHLLLVHSPLLGPSSMRVLADRATAEGDVVACPDLTASVVGPDPVGRLTSTACEAVEGFDGPVSVVGHSGAGPFLPLIAARLEIPASIIFLDAALPPCSEAHETPPGLRALIDRQTDGGRLRPWLDWWPDEVVESLLPDPTDRAALGRDMPRVPRSFYDIDVPVPQDWCGGGCGYVRLSAAYDDEVAEAARRGWPTITLDSDHLAAYTDPDPVLGAVGTLIDRLAP